MVEGESGLVAVSRAHGFPVHYEPSKRRLTWPNGAMATTYSADVPDLLRGPQHDGAWCDELPAWSDPQAMWDQLQFGLRLGTLPRTVVTTTPRPIQLIRALMKDATVYVTRGSTYDNAANLAPSFLGLSGAPTRARASAAKSSTPRSSTTTPTRSGDSPGSTRRA
jgi:phage terminase large subunit-like protein